MVVVLQPINRVARLLDSLRRVKFFFIPLAELPADDEENQGDDQLIKGDEERVRELEF